MRDLQAGHMSDTCEPKENDAKSSSIGPNGLQTGLHYGPLDSLYVWDWVTNNLAKVMTRLRIRLS